MSHLPFKRNSYFFLFPLHSEIFCNKYSEILDLKVQLVTWFFFLQMYNKVRTGERVKVEHVVTVLEKKYPYVEVNSILGIDSAYDQNRKVNILWCFSSDCNTMLSLPPLIIENESHSVCLTLCDPMDYSIQSMEFSRPEYWSGQPFPSPGCLPNPGIEPRSPALQADPGPRREF